MTIALSISARSLGKFSVIIIILLLFLLGGWEEEAGVDLPAACLHFLRCARDFPMAANRAPVTAVMLIELLSVVRVEIGMAQSMLQVEGICPSQLLTCLLVCALNHPVVCVVADAVITRS